MKSSDLIEKITQDLAIIWGEMAPFMVNKRLLDLGASSEDLTISQCTQLIELLRDKTLKTTLGENEAKRRAMLYKQWMKDCSMLQ